VHIRVEKRVRKWVKPAEAGESVPVSLSAFEKSSTIQMRCVDNMASLDAKG